MSVCAKFACVHVCVSFRSERVCKICVCILPRVWRSCVYLLVSGKFECVDTLTSSQVVRVCPASHDD
jgi:hypothetical protein